MAEPGTLSIKRHPIAREIIFISLLFPLSDDMSTSEPKELQDVEKKETRSENSGEKDVTDIYNPHVDVSGVDEAKLIRKIDWRLLPWLSFLYLLSFLDRTSIGNARVRCQLRLLWAGFNMNFRQLYHLTDDLHLSDKQYLLCLTIFYFSYASFEVCLTISFFWGVRTFIEFSTRFDRSQVTYSSKNCVLAFGFPRLCYYGVLLW